MTDSLTDGNPLPPLPFLKECFDYNPDTGFLLWKFRPLHHFKNKKIMSITNSRHAGMPAGSLRPSGYLTVNINGTLYRNHRIIWKLVTGKDPRNIIDHTNEQRSDNRWSNLREATRSQNLCNRKAPASNRSGFKGVSYHKAARKYSAYINVKGKRKYIGLFKTAAEAHKRYCEAGQLLHGNFFNPGWVDKLG